MHQTFGNFQDWEACEQGGYSLKSENGGIGGCWWAAIHIPNDKVFKRTSSHIRDSQSLSKKRDSLLNSSPNSSLNRFQQDNLTSNGFTIIGIKSVVTASSILKSYFQWRIIYHGFASDLQSKSSQKEKRSEKLLHTLPYSLTGRICYPGKIIYLIYLIVQKTSLRRRTGGHLSNKTFILNSSYL